MANGGFSRASDALTVGVLAASLLAAGAAIFASCRDQDRRAVVTEDASFGRRVFKAPTGEVRALPPHNIHRNGVGPYELNASFQKTLAVLPNGPRVELFQAEGLFDYRLMRADNDSLVLGVGRHNRLDFISVLDPDIARTESGIGVGAGLDELIGALGAVQSTKDGGRDSRIVIFSSLPDTRFIVEKKKVVAAVVMPPSSSDSSFQEKSPEERAAEDKKKTPGPEPKQPGAQLVPVSTVPSPVSRCRADELHERRTELLAVANVKSKRAAMVTGCLLSDPGEAVIRTGETLKLVTVDDAAGPKVWGEVEVPGLSFAAIVATASGRPDLYTVAQRQDLEVREVEITRYKLSPGRITPTWSRTAFQLKATSASWIGARIQAADFLVEIGGSDGALIVGGLYVQREGDALRMVVPVEPVEIPVGPANLRREEAPAPSNAAPAADAGNPVVIEPSRLP